MFGVGARPRIGCLAWNRAAIRGASRPVETGFKHHPDNMKSHLTATLLATGFLSGTVLVQAQFPGHYPPGVEGIKGPSLPPPGVYLRDYNLYYNADQFPGGPATFNANVYVNAPRLIWMTEKKILGANYGMDIIVPFGWADVKAGAMRDSYFGLYDIQIEPLLLAWHLPQLDIGAGYSIWVPTGETPTATEPIALGKGFFSHMFTLGATWYADAEKTWALSALNRYEIHHRDNGATVGNSYTVEFGASKTLAKTWDVGVAGYYQGQVTSGSPSAGHANVLGVGPEVSVAFPDIMTFVSLRWIHEMEAHLRPEGDTFTLTLTKRF